MPIPRSLNQAVGQLAEEIGQLDHGASCARRVHTAAECTCVKEKYFLAVDNLVSVLTGAFSP